MARRGWYPHRTDHAVLRGGVQMRLAAARAAALNSARFDTRQGFVKNCVFHTESKHAKPRRP